MSSVATGDPPEWLPPLVEFAASGNQWDAYVKAIYAFYSQDFRTTVPEIEGFRWLTPRSPLVDGKETGFWHIISEGKLEEERLPDFRRCERIRWPRAMLEAIGSDKVVCWEQSPSSRDRRLVVALPDYSYVVVVALRRNGVAVLITAYPVEPGHSRRKFAQQRAAWDRDNPGGN